MACDTCSRNLLWFVRKVRVMRSYNGEIESDNVTDIEPSRLMLERVQVDCV
jgi:hypothetical protein